MFKRVVITSGPTIEPIDPVRFISNRSSGKSGYHLANEAVRRGAAEVIFITGPTCYIPELVTVVPVETALEMKYHVHNLCPTADVIIKAAAVSDYRPRHVEPRKIKKGLDSFSLELVKNPDMLMELGHSKPPGQILVGYAAETHNSLENARKKFTVKNLDLLVLNEISPDNPAFNADDNQVYLLTAEGHKKLPKMSKADLAVRIWDEIIRLSLTEDPDAPVRPTAED